jgi:hypothetical protein
MRLCPCLLVAAACPAVAQPDPREIVRRSLDAFEGENSKIALSYTFLERVETRQLDGDGRVKSKSAKTHDVTMVEGSPYRRPVERDDEPLPAEEERRQQEDLRKSIEARLKETPKQREKRLADFEKQRTKYRDALREIPDAYNFRLLGEEEIDGRPVYIIEGLPKPGYRPRSRYARLFAHLKGTLRISKTDYHWARTEAELIDNFHFGWILVRVAKGARVRLEQTRVNDEVWLPLRVWFVASARIGIFKRVNVEQENTYSRYRKFQAESRIVSTGAAP